jgi:hypothetical protein
MLAKIPNDQQKARRGSNSTDRIVWSSLTIGLIAGLAALLAVAVIGLVLFGGTNRSDLDASAVDRATQTVDGGSVSVTATWNGVAAGPVFSMAMDTHSVDLDDIDLSVLAVLRVDGVEVMAISWDAPKGGHHREGVLAFPDTLADGTPLIGSGTSAIELVVRDVAGVPERVFQWTP